MEKLALLGGGKVRRKPFINTAIIGKEERKRVLDVLDSGILSGFVAKAGDNFLGGKQVKELESLLKGYFKSKYAVSVNSATAGLHAALGAIYHERIRYRHIDAERNTCFCGYRGRHILYRPKEYKENDNVAHQSHSRSSSLWQSGQYGRNNEIGKKPRFVCDRRLRAGARRSLQRKTCRHDRRCRSIQL